MSVEHRWARDGFVVGDDTDLFEFEAAAAELARQLRFLQENGGMGATVVSIEGPWGSGKTTFANMLWREAMRTVKPAERPVRVQFNAWLSTPASGSAWAALAERIGEALYQRLRRVAWPQGSNALQRGLETWVSAASKGGVGAATRRAVGAWCWALVRGCVSFFRHGALTLPRPSEPGDGTCTILVRGADDRRHHWTEVAWRLSVAVPAWCWHPCLNLFCDGPSKLAGRGLDGATGVRTLGKLALSTSKIKVDPVGALSEAGAAADVLGQAMQAEAHRLSPDSQEFVEHLDHLSRVLGPEDASLRLWVEIEDISRLDQQRLERVLAALAYVHGLRHAIVVLLLDRHQADALVAGARAGSEGEGALVRTIHLRQQVPKVLPRHLAQLVDEWVKLQGIPAPAAERLSSELTDMWYRYGLRTPRQVKRGLVWMHQRLRPSADELLDRHRSSAHQPLRPAAILALAAIYLHLEGSIDLATLDGELEGLGPPGLNSMPRQLWAARNWPDGAFFEPQDPPSARLLWRIRVLEVVSQFDAEAPLIGRLKQEVARTLVAWGQDRAAQLWAGVRAQVPSTPSLPEPSTQYLLVSVLMDRVHADGNFDYFVHAGVLSSAARTLAGDQPTGGERPRTPRGVRALLDEWYQQDAFEWAAEAWEPEAGSFARMLGAVLHPKLEPGDLSALQSGAIEVAHQLIKERDALLTSTLS